jgi:WD40 repeat protein
MSNKILGSIVILIVIVAASCSSLAVPTITTPTPANLVSTVTFIPSPIATRLDTSADKCSSYDVIAISEQEGSIFSDGVLTQIGSGQYCDIRGITIAFSPDGSLLAVANYDGVRLYSSVSGKLLRFLPSTEGIWNIMFHPDGKQLASIAVDGEVRTWKVESGETIWFSPPANHEFVLWPATSAGVSYSADGSSLITWAIKANERSSIRLFNAENGESITTLPMASGNVVNISPDGKFLVYGTDSGWELYEIQMQEVVLTSKESEPVSFAAFTLDGKRLYTTNWLNGHITSWNANSGKKIYSFGDCDKYCEMEQPMDLYARFGLSTDSSRLITIDPFSVDQVYIWDTKTKKLKYSFNGDWYISDVAITQDGKLCAALVKYKNEAGFRVLLWHLS